MTTKRTWHIAQANIARMRAPIDAPLMAGFVAQLESINAIADASPGFVWRLQTEQGDATSIRAFEDEHILFNMSVWESIEALRNYVYKSGHTGPLRDRKKWFEPLTAPSLVLWWVPQRHIPTVEEAKERLELLKAKGPTAEAFTFRQWFPPPSDESASLAHLDAIECEWAT